MRILVTGASGFLGCQIVKILTREGHQVRALVLPNDPAPGLDESQPERFSGDVLDPATLRPALAGCEAAVHAAGRVNLGVVGREAMARLHVEGTRNVLAEACRAGLRKVVHISSIGVLGSLDRPGMISEDNPPPPGPSILHHHYNRSKLRAEKIFFEFQANLERVAVLPPMLWGPGDRNLSSTGYLRLALAGLPVHYTVGGTNILDVEDVARGVALALAKGRDGERYVLAGENLSTERMCRLIAEAAGAGSSVRPVSRRLLGLLGRAGEVLGHLGIETGMSMDVVRLDGYWWLDGAKANRELGFTYALGAEQAIRRSVEWMRQEIGRGGFAALRLRV